MYEPWPALSAKEFQKSSHLLHMCVQAVGKLMLALPFEPHWANIAMPLTSRGITTGAIPHHLGTFTVDMDFISHVTIFTASWGEEKKMDIHAMSVADLTAKIFKILEQIGVHIEINPNPQEISNPIPFHLDTASRMYDPQVVNAWWRIMLSTYRVLLTYHSKFYGITPKIGLFWGTLDLRDARYKGCHLPPSKETSNFIARNAMDDIQFEVGWSSSNEKYPFPAFFAFAYPKPHGYENAKIKPKAAKWISDLNEFVLDYETIRKSKNPESDLLDFFDSTYQAFADLDQWDRQLLVKGKAL